MMLPFAVLCLALANFNGAQAQDCSNTQLKVDPASCCPVMPSALTPEVIMSCQVATPEANKKAPCENMKCLLRKLRVMAGGGKVNRNNVLQTFKNLYSADWEQVITDGVNKCVQRIDTRATQCEARAFSECLFNELIKNCPANLWTQSTECEEVKNFVTNCVQS